MSIISTILYIPNKNSKKKKKKKNTVFNRLKIKKIFFYIYPRSSRTEFFNCFRVSVNNTKKTNISSSDDSKIAYINT